MPQVYCQSYLQIWSFMQDIISLHMMDTQMDIQKASEKGHAEDVSVRYVHIYRAGGWVILEATPDHTGRTQDVYLQAP